MGKLVGFLPAAVSTLNAYIHIFNNEIILEILFQVKFHIFQGFRKSQHDQDEIYRKMQKVLKGPFRDPQLHPPIFPPKVEIFILVEVFRYIMFVQKIFLLVWRNNHIYFCIFHVDLEIPT